MESTDIKEKLHHYIDIADEKKLHAIYTILEDEIEGEYFYAQDEINMFYDRRQKYLSGEAKTSSAEETLNLIRKTRK
jgi:hypothetical protein